MRRPTLAPPLLPLLLACALVFLPSGPARAAQPPDAFLVKDINAAPPPIARSSYPSQAVALGDAFFFAADDGVIGNELWRSDGTAASTRPLLDLNPGPAAADIRALTAVNGRLVFVAADRPGASPTIWSSDGTAAGTRRISRLWTNGFTVAGDTAFFLAFWGSAGLWATGGTPETTRQVLAGEEYGITAPDEQPVALGERVVFAARKATASELWQSDGTPAGTSQLASFPCGLGPFAGRASPAGELAFFAYRCPSGNDASRAELWVTDGTDAGTHALYTFPQPAQPHYPFELMPLGNRLVFSVQDDAHGRELWVYDGAGARVLNDIQPGPLSSGSQQLTPLGDTIYFTASDGTTAYQLWATDGTPEGTRMVKGFAADGNAAPKSVEIEGVLGTTLFISTLIDCCFPVSTGALWRSDGTAAGTQPILQKAVGPASIVNDELFFWTDDPALGREPWLSDGTVDGTRLLKNIAPEVGNTALQSLIPVSGGLLFAAQADAQSSIYSTAGTEAGTLAVKDIRAFAPYGFSPNIASLSGLGFFLDKDGGLARSDGTPAGTSLVKANVASSIGTDLISTGPALYFFGAASGPGKQVGLWASDGTPAGTRLIADVPYFAVALAGAAQPSIGGIDPPPIFPANLTAVGGRLFFSAYAPGKGAELWTSDGTAAGTRLVADIAPGENGSYPSELTALGGSLLFFTIAEAGSELWRSDGTAAGTTRLAQFAGREAVLDRFWLTGANGRAFFSATDDAHGRELWASDGTAAGTRLVADILPGADGSYPQSLAVAGGELFFSADDGAHGRELWASNGTAAGTRLVADILPGPAPSGPAELASPNGLLAFSADDGAHGRELWLSDGTAAGTRLAADINPGEGSSAPAGFAALGDTLFFAADGGAHGRELWGYDGRPGGLYASVPPVVGGASGAVVGVPVQVGNGAASDIAGTLTLSVTLDTRVAYVSDTFGVEPMAGGDARTWSLLAPAPRARETHALLVRLPEAPLGARFPLTVSYSAPAPAGATSTSTYTVELMVAERVFLPAIWRR